MTTIEKVEEAIKFALGIDNAKEAAKAAIEAMRHPSDEMVDAGEGLGYDSPLDSYRAMIEAALKEIPDPEQN